MTEKAKFDTTLTGSKFCIHMNYSVTVYYHPRRWLVSITLWLPKNAMAPNIQFQEGERIDYEFLDEDHIVTDTFDTLSYDQQMKYIKQIKHLQAIPEQ